MTRLKFGCLAGLLLLPVAAFASFGLPKNLDEHFAAAGAVFRGTATEAICYRDAADGLIYTRTSFRVDEVFKGKFPATIQLVQRGGEAGGIGFSDDASPRFKIGEATVLFVARRANRTLFVAEGDAGTVRLPRQKNGLFTAAQEILFGKLRGKNNSGGADVTDQSPGALPVGSVSEPSGDNGGASTNGLLADGAGVPHRFPLPDRGEPVPYLVDATYLPAGITQPNALAAVSNALSVWAAASSFKFVFYGTNNFGTNAASINNNDGYFRIQLHDFYNYIPPGTIVGQGGSWFNTGLLTNANWGSGGSVAGTEFNLDVNGYVVLKHTNVFMQNLTNFTEVLTHEVGHVLGLAHSSDVATNNATLTNSVMYYLAHGDGRGARLNSYDTNVIRLVHPLNTPPYSYPRVMDITTTPTGAPGIAGINQIQLRGYDLQTANLTAATNNSSSTSGAFSLAGSNLFFTPSAYYSASRIDPATLSYYSILHARFSDGTNASPYVSITTVSLNPDSVTPTDGIPDAWMSNYFGHIAPMSGDKSFSTNDADGDKLTNLQEYIAGMTPTNSASAQRITLIQSNVLQWQAKAYELYEVLGTTNLAASNSWARVGNPVLPTTATGTFSNFYNAALPQQFFRVLKVP